MSRKRLARAFEGRGVVLLPVCALLVHQLRYLLAYGSSSPRVLAAQGHSYVTSLAPWLVLLLGLALGGVLVRIAAALRGHDASLRRRSFVELWLVTWLVLLAVYVVQEFVEGLFAAGHPGGLAGIFGAGGWWAVPVSLVVGAALAGLLSAAAAVVDFAARLARRSGRRGPLAAPHVPAGVALRLGTPLARLAAGRAPPGAAPAAAAGR